jgi:hypothetical protein
MIMKEQSVIKTDEGEIGSWKGILIIGRARVRARARVRMRGKGNAENGGFGGD